MTAVQQVFSDLEKLHPHLFNMHSVEGREFVNHFYKYLAVERKQITKAFDMGEKYEHHYLKNSSPKINSDEYYNETFKQQRDTDVPL